MIQPQKEQPFEAHSKASLKSHEEKERKKKKKENQQSPEPDNFILSSTISENCKAPSEQNIQAYRVENLFPWSIHTNIASC